MKHFLEKWNQKQPCYDLYEYYPKRGGLAKRLITASFFMIPLGIILGVVIHVTFIFGGIIAFCGFFFGGVMVSFYEIHYLAEKVPAEIVQIQLVAKVEPELETEEETTDLEGEYPIDASLKVEVKDYLEPDKELSLGKVHLIEEEEET